MNSPVKLPYLLRQVEFQPLETVIDHESLGARVLRHAENYLDGHPLLLVTTVLSGPFDRLWHNPWLGERNQHVIHAPTNALKRKRQQERRKRQDLARSLRVAVDSSSTRHLSEAPDQAPFANEIINRDKSPTSRKGERQADHSRNLSTIASRPLSPVKFTALNHISFQTPKEDGLVPASYDGCSPSKMPDTSPGDAYQPALVNHHTLKARIVDNVVRDIPPPAAHARKCTECATSTTNRWMKGPEGPATLCGRCGARFYRQSKKLGNTKSSRTCSDCGTRTSTNWRAGPNGPSTLCNECGKRFSSRPKQSVIPKPLHQSGSTGLSVAPLPALNNQQELKVTNTVRGTETTQQESPPDSTDEKSLARKLRGLRSHSQPELSNKAPLFVHGVTSWPSSFPNAKRPILHHRELMQTLFPGGLLNDASNQHGQLMDLMEKNAASQMSGILRIPAPETALTSTVSKSGVLGIRKARKKRVMTFDTPIANQASRSATSWPKPLFPTSLKAQEDFGTVPPTVPSPASGEPAMKETENPLHTRLGRSVQDSPFISTQAAMLQAHIAFQEGLDSPQNPIPTPRPTRRALQDRTNIPDSPAPPLRKLTQIGNESSPFDTESQNTQALFDNFTMFPFSPGVGSSPKMTEKDKKRASFAPDISSHDHDEHPVSTGDFTDKDRGTPISLQSTASNSLRKSALKKSGAKFASSCANSLWGSSPAAGGGGVGGTSDDMDLGSFLQDADEFLRT